MIWHIFKKDFRLLWPYAAGLALLEFVAAILRYQVRHGAGLMDSLESMIEGLNFIAAGALIATLVHQDSVTGTRHDWLVRPIRREDLIGAKLTFAILAMGLPFAAISLASSVANGVVASSAFTSTLLLCIVWLAVFVLPALALASMTDSLAQTLAGAAIAFGMLSLVGMMANLFGWSLSAQNGATGPIVRWPANLLLATMMLGVLAAQIYRRRTVWARGVTAAFVVGWAFGQLLVPYPAAFAALRRFSPQPSSGESIQIAYDPSLGALKPSPQGPDLERYRPEAEEPHAFYGIPIRITGMPAGSVLEAQHLTAFIRSAGSASAEQVEGISQPTWPQPFVATVAKDVPGHAILNIPNRLVSSNTPVRVELEFSFSLSRLSNTATIPALSQFQRVEGAGSCTSSRWVRGMLDVTCFNSTPPSCIGYMVKNSLTGAQNPSSTHCFSEHALFGSDFAHDAVRPVRAYVSLDRDSPVDSSQLSNSELELRVYQTQDYFTRRIVIPEIKLGDWLQLKQAPSGLPVR